VRPNVLGHSLFVHTVRGFFHAVRQFFYIVRQFYLRLVNVLFISCAHLGYVAVSCGSWRLGRQAISSIPSKSKHLSNCSSTKTTSQAPSRPLSRLPILSCPPICRIRMFRRRTYRLLDHPPRFNPRCLPHFKRGGRWGSRWVLCRSIRIRQNGGQLSIRSLMESRAGCWLVVFALCDVCTLDLDCCKMCLHGVTRAPEMMHDPKKRLQSGSMFFHVVRVFHVLRPRFFHVLRIGPTPVHDPKKKLTAF